jgi:hypothetical protein
MTIDYEAALKGYKPEFIVGRTYLRMDGVPVKIIAENDPKMWPYYRCVQGDDTQHLPGTVEELAQIGAYFVKRFREGADDRGVFAVAKAAKKQGWSIDIVQKLLKLSRFKSKE